MEAKVDIVRKPVRPDPAQPRCYALEHDAADRVCQQCGYGLPCAELCRQWRAVETLAAAERVARAAISVTDPALDASEVYARCYRSHFGRVPTPAQLLRIVPVMHRVLVFCQERNLDVATYVNAQMHAMKPALAHLRTKNGRYAGRRFGFQPTMLLGEGALVRYNSFVHAARARYTDASAEVFDGKTRRGALLVTLTLAEIAVGEIYVGAALSRAPLTWEEATQRARPSDVWAKPQEGSLRRASRLAAMVQVVDAIRYGLSRRLASRLEWTWERLAETLVRVLPFSHCVKTDVTDHAGGILYRAGAGS